MNDASQYRILNSYVELVLPDKMLIYVAIGAEDGKRFNVTISGNPSAQAKDFVGALQSVAFVCAQSVGGSIPGAKYMESTDIN